MTTKTALSGVRVFDGERLSAPRTVVIDGEVISGSTDTAGVRVIDGAGAVLLPGLIDAHVHVDSRDTLAVLASFGITTALDMACWPTTLVDSLRNVPGVTDIRSAGVPAIGPAGPHSHFIPAETHAVVLDPGDAEAFVKARVHDGSDYLKIVLEAPGQGGPDQATAAAFVSAAHAAGKKTVAHASSVGAFQIALEVGADVVTHLPKDAPLSPEQTAFTARGERVSVPTLTMEESLAKAFGKPEILTNALNSAAQLHQAGVQILAGTDAHTQGSPADVAFGESLHHELEFLTQAGLSPAEVLRAATVDTARYFNLTDRGAITPGLRADLLLIDGDPLADIRATRNIITVWCAGTEIGRNDG